jgi:hypothetical protein
MKNLSKEMEATQYTRERAVPGAITGVFRLELALRHPVISPCRI